MYIKSSKQKKKRKKQQQQKQVNVLTLRFRFDVSVVKLSTDESYRLIDIATSIYIFFFLPGSAMSFPYKYLKIGNLGKLRKITISNPKRKNALNVQAYQELTGKVKKCFVLLNFELNHYSIFQMV